MRTKQENLELFKKYFAPYEIVSYNLWKSLTDKIIRWMRLPELEVRFRFPFIMIIYLSLVFLSVILAVELGK